jgi:hypothetical protein
MFQSAFNRTNTSKKGSIIIERGLGRLRSSFNRLKTFRWVPFARVAKKRTAVQWIG